MTRRVVVSLLALVLVGAFALQSPVKAQVNGRVVDPDGAGIPGVVVQLRSEGDILVGTRSDGQGAFTFEADAWEKADEVVAERMGFHPYRRPLAPGDTEPRIVLDPSPVPIEGVAVEAAAETCQEASGDDGTGRLIWELVQERYAQGFDTLGIASYVRHARTRAEEAVPSLPPSEELEKRQRGSAPLLRARWNYRVQEEGYGYRVRRIGSSGPYESWVFPPLEADFAPHFVSTTFGDLHHIRFLGTSSRGWQVAFCPRDEEGVAIEGTLTVAPDTTLVEAEWVFRTSEPEEAAGGRAVFEPPLNRDGAPWPLPREGLFWRELPEGEHRHEYTLFEDWTIAQGDSVPFLPPREGEEEPAEGPTPPP